MDHPKLAKTVYALLLALCYFNWMRVYSRLPQRVAVHFGYDGSPNGWAPKDVFLWMTLIVVVILPVTTFAIPRLITAVSGDRVNLPHREYWLAPARRQRTMTFIEAQGAWFGCAVLLLLFTAFQLAMNENLSPERHFDSATMWTALVIFFVLVILWTIRFIRHFYRLPSGYSEP